MIPNLISNKIWRIKENEKDDSKFYNLYVFCITVFRNDADF